MRLTLRTLLAYMDDMLDPEDQEELGRKIEASPFATELIHRSRDAVRRLRLSAPDPLPADADDLHGSDSYLDPNTAAEYLDSTLPPDEVGEFERHCLEAGPNADMLLAEAVSCHHILTLVLGEPAEVDADLRQRMYGIVAHSEPAVQRTDGAHREPRPEPAEPSHGSLLRRPPVDPDEAAVPDYILEAARVRRRKRNQLIALMVVSASLAGLVVFFMWPQGEPELPPAVAQGRMGNVGDLDNGVAESGDQTADAGPPKVDQDAQQAAIDAGGEPPPFNADAATSPPPAAAEPDLPATGDLALDLPLPADSGGGTPAAPPEGLVPGGTTAPPAVPISPATDAALGAPNATNTDAGGAATMTPSGGLLADAGTSPIPTPGADALPATGAEAAGADATAAPAAPSDAGPGATAPEGPTAADAAADFAGGSASRADTTAAPPRQAGVYLGLNNDLLLRYSPALGQWVRLAPRSALAGGDRLLVLPNFVTLAGIGADVNAILGGGSEVIVAAPAAGTADSGLEIVYGRVVLNSGLNGNRIAVTVGDQTRVFKLAPSSTLAVEVARSFVRGSDPATEPAPMTVTWYLRSGKAEWNDGSSDLTAEGAATWATLDGVDQPPQALKDLPAWIDGDPISNVEAGARDAIAASLPPGEPVNLALLELTSPAGLGRRTEVRSLAARSGAYVGEFEPLVKALSDPAERARRKEQVETLRAAIARSPDAVEKIHDAIELQLGQQSADDLTEMLLGYSAADVGTTKDEVKQGVLVRLIDWLNNEQLAYRVLASYNLNEITGTSYLGGYRPEHAQRQREREMRFYWDRLEKGELMPR
jgi:hypothetical protein